MREKTSKIFTAHMNFMQVFNAEAREAISRRKLLKNSVVGR